jgi:hypothetical protein
MPFCAPGASPSPAPRSRALKSFTADCTTPAPGPPSTLNAGNFPHVHTDHPLDLALRRLAESRLAVLPVVSRSNVRELRGTIATGDILAAYGMRKGPGEPAQPAQPTGSSWRLLAGIAAALIVLAALGGFLNYFYRTERLARAGRYFRQGDEFMRNERYGEAIEQYRDALSITHAAPARLALANALVKAGRLQEAEVYFQEFLGGALPCSGTRA